MRRPLLGYHLLALTIVLAGCAGSPYAASVPLPAWEEDEAAIRTATSASAEAWNRGDLKGHLAIYADSVTFMTRTGPRPGIAPIEEQFSRLYFRDGKPKQALRFEQVVVRRLDRDSALQTGRFVLSGGGEAEQSGWFTLIWVRTADGWKAVHDHSS